VERYIRSVGSEKRVVLLLNKIDLVPRDSLEAWLKYFREEIPALAFKSSTQQQSANLKQGSIRSRSKGLDVSECLGADTLLQLLKNYSRSMNLKTSITVGIVGLPNVGKSSVINSLKRARVAQTGNMPGVTKSLQEIHLDKNVKLIDCPGIVFTSGSGDAASVLRNCVKIEKLDDPVTPVQEILKRVPVKNLMKIYNLPAFATHLQFLALVAKSRGRLRPGGTPDMEAAARMVLQDWTGGRIPYYTSPPARENLNKDHEAARVVQEWAPGFDLDAIAQTERGLVLDSLKAQDATGFVAVSPPRRPSPTPPPPRSPSRPAPRGAPLAGGHMQTDRRRAVTKKFLYSDTSCLTGPGSHERNLRTSFHANPEPTRLSVCLCPPARGAPRPHPRLPVAARFRGRDGA